MPLNPIHWSFKKPLPSCYPVYPQLFLKLKAVAAVAAVELSLSVLTHERNPHPLTQMIFDTKTIAGGVFSSCAFFKKVAVLSQRTVMQLISFCDVTVCVINQYTHQYTVYLIYTSISKFIFI